jgi:hypothetical protein
VTSGGRRTERISERDLEVLEWVARFGVVPRGAVGLWAGTGQTVTWTRERRLRDAGLLELHPAVGDSGPLVLCTRAGLKACGRGELAVPPFSAPRVFHSAIVDHVAARIERAGDHVLSEREIFARERAEGERLLSAELPGGRYHRPDLILLGDRIEAIEVELTDKAAQRLDALLRAWLDAVILKRVARVIYLCSPHALRYVERSLVRIRAEGSKLITAAPLQLAGLASAELPPDLLANLAAARSRQSRAAGPTPRGVDGRAAAATVATRSGGRVSGAKKSEHAR